MIDLLDLHKYFILKHLREGDVAVDFTMGNGYDTAFLSQTVGERGKVYAFDIQAAAVESTRRHLEEIGAPKNYTLIHASHHLVKDYVKEPIRAGMFNLGWLPGGDKSITTLRETTLPAIQAAIELLDRDAILNVAVYPGHEEGDAEGKMICEYLASISRYKVCATRINILNSPTSPYFIMIETKP
ncbi:MAG: class I SAM-dependent methyltransferase [Clostridia bacterium]|nr:class I SAM-dependent methyltransferase [Clostridia bacterium]MBR2927346.1 class I SAM-dependent methyltransferase [Clostridia bacterium]